PGSFHTGRLRDRGRPRSDPAMRRPVLAFMKTFAKNLSAVFLGLFAAFFLVEGGMRTLGRGILAVQGIRNEIRPDDSEKLRILTIGESTTADRFDDPGYAWPRQLEQKLTQSGLKARVYNLGVAGTTSSFILERLGEQVDLFQPHIVISMIGINDSLVFVASSPAWWDRFRVVKLLRWSSFLWKQPDVFPPKNFLTSAITEKVLASMGSDDLSVLESEVSRLGPVEKAQTYLYIAEALNRESGSPLTYELIKRSLAARFQG
ncbi:MAG: GDSL-type esterase/lipase family protein, partial [Bdellovibrionia bacterium]